MSARAVRIPENKVAHSRHDPATDHLLVHGVRSGDARAFKQLYLQFYQRLLEFVFGLVRSRETAKDVVQDVFSDIWERRETWQVTEYLDTYLYQAVRYRALHVLRHERLVDQKHEAMQMEEGAPLGFGTPELTPDEALSLKNLHQTLNRAVTALPAAQREAILLHWRHGLSNAEVARVMGRTPGAVAVYISRARETLRQVLGREE